MQSVTSTIATHDSHNEADVHSNTSIDTENNIKVAVRIRRFLPNEAGEKCIHILTTPSHKSPIIQIGTASSIRSYSTNASTSMSGMSQNSSSTGSGTLGGKSFFFDQAFSQDTKQKHIFQTSVRPLIDACLKGYNATVLAYGQTGSGKTYTILGPSAESIVAEEVRRGSPIDNHAGSQAGVIPRALRDLFNRLEATKKKYQLSHNVDLVQNKKGQKPYEYEVRVQFLELYGEEIRDLLSKSTTKLVIRDGGGGIEPEVIGASEVRVQSAEEALLCLTRGTLRRVTGATAMNSESSRSHAIMTVIVEQTTVVRPNSAGVNFGAENNKGEEEEEGTVSSNIRSSSSAEVECKRSKFHFVDLAGSERQKRSMAQGQRLREGIDINKGLLVLGNVISALGDPKKRGNSFVPYRDSKLTRLLKGSLGGNHKTIIIACVSPSSINLEESLNCLRYANRAKNIENNAVINLDAGSRLVAELRAQLKSLAGELLIFQEQNGEDSSRLFKISDLRNLANGGDCSKLNFSSRVGKHVGGRDDTVDQSKNDKVKGFKAEIAKLTSMTKQLKNDISNQSEEIFAAKAEAEYYRLGGHDEASENNQERKVAFVNRVRAYEREIVDLKKQLRTAINLKSATGSEQSQENLKDGTISSSVSSGHAKRRVLNSIITTDSENKESDRCLQKITKKYLRIGEEKNGSSEYYCEEFGDPGVDCESTEEDVDEDEDEDETFTSRQSILDSHMIQLSKGIAAKEELIDKLGRSQIKYEKMKSFYEEKLHKMTMHLSIQEAERMSLEVDLKKNMDDVQKYKELKDKLEEKQKHIDHLKIRQAEIKNLTSIASRNESVISNLTNEITTMKKQKEELQHQLIRERKEHARSMQHLRKKAAMHKKGVTKIRHQLAITTAQKERAQDVAKVRAEKITELRSKFEGAEKKLRMQTLKRGVMERVGIDPVLVGRQERSNVQRGAQKRTNGKRTYGLGDINKMRNLLDDKIAEVSRKEAAADKLASEWEDHFELSGRKENLLIESKGKKHDVGLSDELEALDFQIKYKESRIRQLAHRLGNKSTKYEPLIDDKKFRSIMSELPPLVASQLASKVLFGMVVRERRRVAALARAASTMDQKAVEAQKVAALNENALRSLLDETKNERVAMAQTQQEKILSLMDIVQGDEKKQYVDGRTNGVEQSSCNNSIVLQLANERIETLESQLSDLYHEKETRENYQAREAETVTELTQLTTEYGKLMGKSRTLRGYLLKIHKKISSADENSDPKILDTISRILNKALHTGNDNSKDANKNTLERLSDPYESDSGDEDIVDLPDWAGHIMKDLAIIAAGDVPASLKTPNKQQLPPTIGGNIFDRLSSPDNFTVSHYERLSDSSSVTSNAGSHRSQSRTRSLPTSRSRHSTPSRSVMSSIQRPTQKGYESKQRSHYSASPLRQNSPDHSRTRITDRVSAILKDAPPRVLTLQTNSDDDDQSLNSYRSLGSHSLRSNRSQKGKSKFVEAYTKKDVFERLQKKHTNSFTLNIQASHSFENCGR